MTKRHIETEIELNKKTLRKTNESIRQHEAAGMERSDGQEIRRRNLERAGVKLLELRAAAATIPQELGHIIVSEKAMTDDPKPKIVDWAFVSVDNVPDMSLSDHNVLPTKAELRDDGRPNYGKDTRYQAEEGSFRGFSTLEKGEWYFKKGSTTGIAGGIYHGTHLIMKCASHSSDRASQRRTGKSEAPTNQAR